MTSAIMCMVDAATAGRFDVAKDWARTVAGINCTWQLRALPELWPVFKPLCPHLMAIGCERRPANALNVEIGQPLDRCKLRSPDGKGLAWLLSGGSALAYGCCGARHCPLMAEAA